MKKLAEQHEEEEAKRKLLEPEAPVVKHTAMEDTDMDELLDADVDEDLDEIAENFGDLDEDDEDI
jgi:hypothetical protein